LTDIDAGGPEATGCVRVHRSVLRLVKADITTLDVEAFVFYARPSLALGSGFGNAIARRGGPAIKKELDGLGPIAPTDAVVTSGGNLKARHIVHAAGPVFQEAQLQDKLRATIVHALERAEERGVRQIAFPPMGAGFYGVPLPLCADLMVSTILSYLSNSTGIREVVLCANDARERAAFEARLAALSPAPARPPTGTSHE
jgi:O-acetyl-ADP-ribose deacetylase (regulator of RNase III)